MAKTIRMKILVGLSDDGEWAAFGAKGASRSDLEDGVTQDLGGGQRLFRWVTAEIPAPDWSIPEIEAGVA